MNNAGYPGLFMKRKDCRASWALFEVVMNLATLSLFRSGSGPDIGGLIYRQRPAIHT